MYISCSAHCYGKSDTLVYTVACSKTLYYGTHATGLALDTREHCFSEVQVHLKGFSQCLARSISLATLNCSVCSWDTQDGYVLLCWLCIFLQSLIALSHTVESMESANRLEEEVSASAAMGTLAPGEYVTHSFVRSAVYSSNLIS